MIRGDVQSCGCLLKDITQQRFAEYRISKGLPADADSTSDSGSSGDSGDGGGDSGGGDSGGGNGGGGE